MCVSPGVLAGMSMAGLIGSTISGAFGAYNQAQMQQEMYDYQAKIAKNNAVYAQWQAKDLLTRVGPERAADAGMKARANIGSARATMAARGLDLTVGTPSAVLAGMQQMATTDQKRIAQGTAMEAWAAKVKAQGYSADAALYAARSDFVSPVSAGFGSLLTGAGQVAQSWYSYKQQGIW